MIRQKRKTMGIFKHPKTGIYHANYFDDSGKRCRPSLHTRDKRIAQIKFAEIMQGKEANYFFDNSHISNSGNGDIVIGQNTIKKALIIRQTTINLFLTNYVL